MVELGGGPEILRERVRERKLLDKGIDRPEEQRFEPREETKLPLDLEGGAVGDDGVDIVANDPEPVRAEALEAFCPQCEKKCFLIRQQGVFSS